MKSYLFLLAVCVLFSGCAKNITNYTPPQLPTETEQFFIVEVDRPVEEVWDAAMQYAADTFFVLDNIFRDSYLINLSYSVDNPAEYIDCGSGEIGCFWGTDKISYVKVADRSYEFNRTDGNNLFLCRSNNRLEGRLNILMIPDGASTTIKVKARYIFTNETRCNCTWGSAMPYSEDNSATFDTGSNGSTGNVTCYPKYTLESQVIDGILEKLETIPRGGSEDNGEEGPVQ